MAKRQFCQLAGLLFRKGYVYALLAIRDLMKTYPDVEYHIIGQGPDMAEILFFIENNGLRNSVFLYGALSNVMVKSHLISADIFLLPSVCEGISNSALEAMAIGIPVVSTVPEE